MFDKKQFAKRLSELRINKGVSARDMSLSLGQSPGYINNIENCKNLPSMSVFFSICDYFEITPNEFFETNTPYPQKIAPLFEKIKLLDENQLEIIISMVNQMS